MEISNMELVDWQAANQTKMSRKEENFPWHNILLPQKKKRSERICLSLLEEILQNQKKNLLS